MTEAEPALIVEDLVKAYAGADDVRPAVDGVSFTVESGRFFTLLGPSGCGKSTTLRCIAGLETTDGGIITVDGRVVSSHTPKVMVPPDQRGIGMVFQSYAIWPHMTVFENVAFPLRAARRSRHIARSDIRSMVMESLERVRLEGFASRPATKLSGGQQQRLALARALVGDPSLLLLDEPLSNLDATLREAMRAELRTLQRETGVTTLYVTHDQTEALSMSNVVAVMQDGRIVQAGRPREIYRRPATAFVATFVGKTNLLAARIVDREPGDGSFLLETKVGSIHAVCPEGVAVGDDVSVSIRPEDIRLHLQRPDATPNVFDAAITRRMYLGDAVEYHLMVGDEPIDSRQNSDVFLRRREAVFAEFPVEHCVVVSDEFGATVDAHADRGSDDDDPVDAQGAIMASVLEGAPISGEGV
ncbi:MAG: ABC transporter ATP-binding protein [Actinobacteria bacterium]|nr:ABC transporter ATP-binding protein [Actinomycetota bacterium]